MKQLKQTAITMQLVLILLVCVVTKSVAQDTEKEKAVKAYYSGFEMHDWNQVVNQFADGFTFTCSVDNSVPVQKFNVEKFKENCWGTSKFFKKVNYVKMVEKGSELFLLVEITTTDDKTVRNVDYFNFSGDKIKSIEVFFGPGVKFPGNTDSK